MVGYGTKADIVTQETLRKPQRKVKRSLKKNRWKAKRKGRMDQEVKWLPGNHTDAWM
jgi:hypothetical protein